MAHFILKEQLTKRTRVALILILCVLFLLFDPAHLEHYLIGNLYSLAGCTAFAIYIICSRILSKRGNPTETITLWSAGLAVLTSGIAAVSFESFSWSSLHPASLCYLIFFGLLNAGAFNLVNMGFATVDAGVGTMVLLLEPLIGSILGVVFFHELPTATFTIGAIIMIVAIYIASFTLDT